MDERTLARFISKVEVQPNGCWHWTGKPAANGYGRFWIDGKTRYAHVVAYEHFIGPVPEGYEVDHVCHGRDTSCPGGVCDHRLCVCPDREPEREHLEAVPHHQNVMRGRGHAARNAQKDACNEGHPFTEDNTYYDSRGDRGCRTCQARRVKEWAKANRWQGGKANAEKTHCPQGHPYDEANTVYSNGGKRRTCRTCQRVSNRETKRRQRARKKAQSGETA